MVEPRVLEVVKGKDGLIVFFHKEGSKRWVVRQGGELGKFNVVKEEEGKEIGKLEVSLLSMGIRNSDELLALLSVYPNKLVKVVLGEDILVNGVLIRNSIPKEDGDGDLKPLLVIRKYWKGFEMVVDDGDIGNYTFYIEHNVDNPNTYVLKILSFLIQCTETIEYSKVNASNICGLLMNIALYPEKYYNMVTGDEKRIENVLIIDYNETPDSDFPYCKFSENLKLNP
jgi:hypothetical protein